METPAAVLPVPQDSALLMLQSVTLAVCKLAQRRARLAAKYTARERRISRKQARAAKQALRAECTAELLLPSLAIQPDYFSSLRAAA